MRTHQLHRAGSPRQHKNPDDDEDKQSPLLHCGSPRSQKRRRLCHVDGKILCTHLFSHGNKGIAPQHIAISRPADFIELVMTVIEGIRAKEIGQICRTTIGFDKIL